MTPPAAEGRSLPLLVNTSKKSAPSFSKSVLVVLFMAICTMTVISSIDWTLLLYMNHAAVSSNSDKLYVNATAFALLVPVIANPVLGLLSARWGSGVTLSFACSVSAIGILIMIFLRTSSMFFLIGYELYALCTAFRIVRLSIIAQVVPARNRTTVMAVHQLMAPIGALIGPLLWVWVQRWRGQVIIPLFPPIDRFLVYYTFATGLLMGMTVLGMLTLRSLSRENDIETSRNSPTNNGGGYGATGVVAGSRAVSAEGHSMNAGSESEARADSTQETERNLSYYLRFAYFCAIGVLMQSTMALVRVSFQPILVGVFGADDEHVGKIYSVVGGLALIPPVIVAVMSRVVNDRQIIVFGTTLKLIGTSICLPLFGDVKEWQIVVGFVLCVKASMFFQTATFSAFTKCMGRQGVAKQMGYLWSVCCAGPAIIQFCFGELMIGLFGSWGFGLSLLPVVAAAVMILHPSGWRLLGLCTSD